MHHYFTWSLHLLQAVEWHVVEVARTVKISLLVAHHLLEKVVATCLTLLLLEQQVVR